MLTWLFRVDVSLFGSRNPQDSGTSKGDTEAMSPRLGMVGPGTCHAASEEPTRRIRFLTQDQAAALLRELPRHLRDMAIFALSTGLRAANITGLCWGQVDLERKQALVHPDQAKARRAIAVPLNDTALKVLERQNGIHPVRVFTYGGRARKAGQHDGLVQSAEARRYREIPQARFTAHVGSLACAKARNGGQGRNPIRRIRH